MSDYMKLIEGLTDEQVTAMFPGIVNGKTSVPFSAKEVLYLLTLLEDVVIIASKQDNNNSATVASNAIYLRNKIYDHIDALRQVDDVIH